MNTSSKLHRSEQYYHHYYLQTSIEDGETKQNVKPVIIHAITSIYQSYYYSFLL